MIDRQTQHLTRLVDDLLDVTRISRGKIELQRVRLDLRDVVRKTADDVRSMFEQSGVELRVEHSVGPLWVEADATRVAQVIGNLLHNAMKFTPPGGKVIVTSGAAAGRAEVTVHDTGIGVEASELKTMFEPFAQADRTLARSQGGLGLGLALVRGLVRQHGGDVSAHSEGAGRGSEFRISLPLAPTQTAAAGAGDEGGASPRARVLIIEDNADAAQSLAEVLQLRGHEVRVARDGRSGIEAASALAPDVVLCDIGLPDIDGYAVARAIRSNAALKDTRLVAVSGYAQPEDQERARQAGFEAHLPKPPRLDKLDELFARESLPRTA